MAKIAFIGLGVMGAPMARNIAKKYSTAVYDVDPAKVVSVPGATGASSIAEVVSGRDVVFLSLPSSEVVKEVVLGKGGLKASMGKGAVVIDNSTTSPTVSQELAASLKESGIDFLDAPVSGGEKAAIEGTLSVMVGGSPDVFERCREVLGSIGTTVVLMGDTGMGGVAKLVNNLIVGVTFVAVAEGFALGTKSGLDPEVLYSAIRNGWAGSKVLDVSAEAVLARNFKPGGSVDIHWKDLGYALDVGTGDGCPRPHDCHRPRDL